MDAEALVVREIVLIRGESYAVARRKIDSGIVATALFALPPDGEPTGRLWARLERRLLNGAWLQHFQ